MVSTKKLACPFCDVKLRIAETLPAGKMIKCPKCGEGFPVPGDNGQTPAPKAAVASSTYTFTQPAEAEKVQRVRKAAPPDDEVEDEQVKARPKPRKRRKNTKEAKRNTPLIWALVLGGGVLLSLVVVLAVIFRPWEKKPEADAVNAPARSTATVPGPARRAGAPEPAAQRPVAEPVASGQPSASAGSDRIASGQRIYEANNCARCHAMGGAGPKGRGARGPDLSGVGANRTIDWLVEQIRDPRAHTPNSRMPSYGDKISEEDLRALASYLASLK